MRVIRVKERKGDRQREDNLTRYCRKHLLFVLNSYSTHSSFAKLLLEVLAKNKCRTEFVSAPGPMSYYENRGSVDTEIICPHNGLLSCSLSLTSQFG